MYRLVVNLIFRWEDQCWFCRMSTHQFPNRGSFYLGSTASQSKDPVLVVWFGFNHVFYFLTEKSSFLSPPPEFSEQPFWMGHSKAKREGLRLVITSLFLLALNQLSSLELTPTLPCRSSLVLLLSTIQMFVPTISLTNGSHSLFLLQV